MTDNIVLQKGEGRKEERVQKAAKSAESRGMYK